MCQYCEKSFARLSNHKSCSKSPLRTVRTTDDIDEEFIDIPNTIPFNFNGKKYHRSVDTNIVYLVGENGIGELVGTYDEATQTIIYIDANLFSDEDLDDNLDESDGEG